jgi:hypothetical protein
MPNGAGNRRGKPYNAPAFSITYQQGVYAGLASFSQIFMVAVAQLVESRIVIPVVAGSSPVSHPIFKRIFCSLSFVPLMSVGRRWVYLLDCPVFSRDAASD